MYQEKTAQQGLTFYFLGNIKHFSNTKSLSLLKQVVLIVKDEHCESYMASFDSVNAVSDSGKIGTICHTCLSINV